MNARWLPATIGLGVAVLLAWALPLLGAPVIWRWPILGVGLLVTLFFLWLGWREGAGRDASKPRDRAKLLRAVLTFHASGTALRDELRSIHTLGPEQYRLLRQEVIDWVTLAYERLSRLDPREAEGFGDPSEAHQLDVYAPVSSPSYALRPLIDLVGTRIGKLKAIRDRR